VSPRLHLPCLGARRTSRTLSDLALIIKIGRAAGPALKLLHLLDLLREIALNQPVLVLVAPLPHGLVRHNLLDFLQWGLLETSP